MLGHTSEKQKTIYISFTEQYFLPPKKYGYNNNLLFIADTNNITDNSTFFLIYFFLRI